MDKTPHQVLAPEDQEKLDKEQILELLTEHNLGENIDLLYKIIIECKNGGHIDDCVKKVVEEFNEDDNKGKSEQDILAFYKDRFKK